MLEINKIYNMDCLEGMKSIPDGGVDMILCDMPYGTTKCKWDIVIPFEPLWEQYKRIIKDRGVIALTAQTPFDKVLGCSNLKWLKEEIIWRKTQATGFFNANKKHLKAHENILVFYNKQGTYNPQKTQGHKPVNSYTKYLKTVNKTEVYGKCTKELSGGGNTDRFPVSVVTFASDKQKNYLHPTQKPVALFEYLIKTYTNEGDLVLDNCAGSGTAGIAAEICGRNSIMIEKEENFCEQIKIRMHGLENSKEISLFG